MLKCTWCKEVLMELPIYNNAQDADFPSGLLFCSNDKCPRSGLLTVAFISDGEKNKDEKKDKKDGNKGIHS